MKRYKWFAGFLLASLGGVIFETWLLQWELRKTQHSMAELKEKKMDLDRLGRQSPAATEVSEQAVERDLNSAREALAEWRARLFDDNPRVISDRPASRSIDAYFDIADFVEKMRAATVGAGVQIHADECFAFTGHRSDGPPAGLVPIVFQQKAVLQYLIETLIAAHPRALLGVRREPPLVVLERSKAGANGPSGKNPVSAENAADYFRPSERLTAQIPGGLCRQAFRLEFSGATESLRGYLNRLAESPWSIAVRSVEVDPIGEPGSTPNASTPTGRVPIAGVGPSSSRFIVVVEFIEPIAAS